MFYNNVVHSLDVDSIGSFTLSTQNPIARSVRRSIVFKVEFRLIVYAF